MICEKYCRNFKLVHLASSSQCAHTGRPLKVLALAHAAGSPTASQSGRLALDGGWAGAAGGRVGAPILEYGEGEHREVDAVEARAHDAEVLEDELG